MAIPILEFWRSNLQNSLKLYMASSSVSTMIIFPLLVASSFLRIADGNFYDEIDIHWGDGRGKIHGDGALLSLSMDQYSGSGFKSKDEYLFGRFDVEMKLVPGNSAGTVTTFYLSSLGSTHDEIDFEFLGNLSGSPYTLHTNVFGQGKGNKEMQFHLWFDPTENFHTYSILWNPKHIIFFVDGIPIRDFRNLESKGFSFPTDQPMRIYASLWDAEDWATRGGLIKTDWSRVPFVAYYRNFKVDACVSPSDDDLSCRGSWFTQKLEPQSVERMRLVQSKYRVYNYCSDVNRFPHGLPQECRSY